MALRRAKSTAALGELAGGDRGAQTATREVDSGSKKRDSKEERGQGYCTFEQYLERLRADPQRLDIELGKASAAFRTEIGKASAASSSMGSAGGAAPQPPQEQGQGAPKKQKAHGAYWHDQQYKQVVLSAMMACLWAKYAAKTSSRGAGKKGRSEQFLYSGNEALLYSILFLESLLKEGVPDTALADMKEQFGAAMVALQEATIDEDPAYRWCTLASLNNMIMSVGIRMHEILFAGSPVGLQS